MTNGGSVISSVDLRRLDLPLTTPYWSMISTLYSFDPIVAVIYTDDGAMGVGECVIVPGYTHEHPDTSWLFCIENAHRMLGKSLTDAISMLRPHGKSHSHAVSCLVVACEMAGGHPALNSLPHERRVPLLAPLHSKDRATLPDEVEARLADGFQVLKVKVGQNVDADLRRVALIQRVVGGRARIRLDANQAFTASDACRFASSLDPAGIELLEQPCGSDEWEAALDVKGVSAVPMMLDESIFGVDDIERAASTKTADYIKLKLVKMAGLDALTEGLALIDRRGMRPILGNGVATEINNWMEACISADRISSAGEMNGFLKSDKRLFRNPLRFENGCIVLPANYSPEIDFEVLDRCTVHRARVNSEGAADSRRRS